MPTACASLDFQHDLDFQSLNYDMYLVCQSPPLVTYTPGPGKYGAVNGTNPTLQELAPYD